MALAAAMTTALLSAALPAALASFSATVTSYAVRTSLKPRCCRSSAGWTADQRPGRGGGPGRHEAGRRRSGPDAARDGGVHLPVLRPAPGAVRGRERGHPD